jgi:hypothetical protein
MPIGELKPPPTWVSAIGGGSSAIGRPVASALGCGLGVGGSAGRLGPGWVLGSGAVGSAVAVGEAAAHAASSAAVAMAASVRRGCIIGVIVSQSV